MSFVMRGARSTFPRARVAVRCLSTGLAPMDSSKLTVKLSQTKKEKLPNEELAFGKTFTDHMLSVDWNSATGWEAPEIIPHGDLRIDPAASSLHYGLQCFEGMKAYVDAEGGVRLFRPDMNMKRMNTSCERLFLPQFDGDQLVECIKELIKVLNHLSTQYISMWPPIDSKCRLTETGSLMGRAFLCTFGPLPLARTHTLVWPRPRQQKSSSSCPQ